MDKLNIKRKANILGLIIPTKNRIINKAIKGKIRVGENIKITTSISKYFFKKKIKIQAKF